MRDRYSRQHRCTGLGPIEEEIPHGAVLPIVVLSVLATLLLNWILS